MTFWQIARRSLFYFWRSNIAVMLGVAVATAVLTGALIVGSSMRTSLRQLTLERLGKIDEILINDGFFRQQLAEEIGQTAAFQQNYSQAVPAILFNNGTVYLESGSGPSKRTAQAANVNVLAIPNEFWSLGEGMGDVSFDDGDAVLNQQLFDQLTAAGAISPDEATLTLRIPKPTLMPSDSALGKKDDLVESLVDLKIAKVIPNRGLGRFGLHPSQTVAENIFIPLEMLQEAICRSDGGVDESDMEKVNAIFLAGLPGKIPDIQATAQLKSQMQPTLEDFGLLLTRAKPNYDGPPIFDYWSLSSDRMVLGPEAVESVQKAFPDAKPVFTYLANDIRPLTQTSGIPFSMIASIDFDEGFQPVSATTGEPMTKLEDYQIVLNEWAAADFKAKPGTLLTLKYFEPETTHGKQVEVERTYPVADIVKLTEPSKPFVFRRRRGIEPAEFDSPPTLANDPDLTPMVKGVTDAETIESWDLPFKIDDKIRTIDDEYWNYYRTTPKAFVSLKTGQELWASRFGNVTSFRIQTGEGLQPVSDKLLAQFSEDGTRLGFELIPVKRNGLAASSGSTPFDALFLGLSMFVIGAALILVSLLFRLGLQARASEIGLYQAMGFQSGQIVSIWLREMMIVCCCGALLGIAMGIGYAALMIFGLKTWWVGAISEPFLELHIDWISLLVGAVSGALICVMTIWWSLRKTRSQAVSKLLAGKMESNTMKPGQTSRRLIWIASLLIVGAIGLSVMAIGLSGDAQAGSFMGSGFLILVAILIFVFRWLRQGEGKVELPERFGLVRLAVLNAKRNPLRSTLTIGLVAVASFLIVSVSSFRLTPTESGTAGFDWVAESSQPIFDDLGTNEGRLKLLGEGNGLPDATQVLSLRFKPGEDASCNNLYQSSQPRVLGVSDQFISYFDDSSKTKFGWAGTDMLSETEKENAWRMLNRQFPATDSGAESVPVVIDKNTANYSLKIFSIGKEFDVNFDSGETIRFKVVGFLNNTILQGSLLISEEHFTRVFPYISGYRYFLVDDAAEAEVPATEVLENALIDQGFDARSAPRLLEGFMAVQNTYLSTFQSLGALGLLLGTFGLAAVQIRNVIERKQELGLMQAVGFPRSKLSQMVFAENASLLLAGIGAGIIAAICATFPHYFIGSASVPWFNLAIMFAAIILVGVLAGRLGARLIGRLPLLESLRT